jgi:hypothetical protein
VEGEVLDLGAALGKINRKRISQCVTSRRKVAFRAYNKVWDVIGICSRHGRGGAGVSGTVIFSNLRYRVDSFLMTLQAYRGIHGVRMETNANANTVN